MSWGARGFWRARRLGWPGAGRAGAAHRLTTFVTLGLAYGFWYACSVFLVAFIREFGWSRSTVAGAFSLLILVPGCRPADWLLVERFRARGHRVGGGIPAAALLLGAQIGAVWQLYLVFGVLAPWG
jgi:hypothetical protein